MYAIRSYYGPGRAPKPMSTVAVAGTNNPVAPKTRPDGAMKAEIPVLAARAIHTRFSTARKRTIARCCHGADELPNQASLVTLTSRSLPCRTDSRDNSGKIV